LNESLQYHRILLIRAAPGGESSRRGEACARAWAEAGTGGVLVFFHGEGVAHAAGEPSAAWRRLAGWHGVALAVCSGSWSRRYDEAPSEPFELSSLARFWDQALSATDVRCFGAEHVG
jgi:hypothetical protein